MLEKIDRFLAWLKSKNIDSHALAGVALVLATLYATDLEFKGAVDAVIAAHPAASKYLTLAVVVITKYSHSSPRNKE